VRLTIVASANRLPAIRAIIPESGIIIIEIIERHVVSSDVPHEFPCTVELVLPTRVIA